VEIRGRRFVEKKNGAPSPPRFDACVPDRVALQIDYELDAATIASGILTAGRLYLPLGAPNGLGTGLYLLAAPSLSSGMPPELNAYAFTGDLRSPLVHQSGSAPDFDYLTVAIRRLEA
jgi:hypothetical protein